MTNRDFADKVGCHYSMASRLRNGHRVPSAHMISRIFDAFEIGPEEQSQLWSSLSDLPESRQADVFGRWLRETIFDREAAPAA